MIALLATLASGAAASDTGGLTGRVAGPEGEPVVGAVVHALRVVDDPQCPSADDACPEPIGTEADADGRWRVSGLPPGEYTIHAADPRGVFGDAWWGGDPPARAAVTAGETTGGIDVTLPEAAQVRGTVSGHDGDPLADTRVSVARTFFSHVETTTAADGRLALDGLARGRHDVTATSPLAGLDAQTRTVDVASGAVATLTFQLDLRPLEVRRLAGATRVETAVAASEEAFDDADHVVVAAASHFPDALAATPLATAGEGPLLLVGRRLPPVVLTELARLGTTSVTIVGGVAAVPLVVELELERAGLEVRRIAGDARFDTAALIADEVGADEGTAVVVSGTGFADALSVAPLAAAEGLPILLTPAGALPTDSAEALVRLGVERTLVVGGAAVVGESVERALPEPSRVAGAERYATSVAVAELGARRGSLDLGLVAVATGRAFPDALTAGSAVASRQAPVLLVDGSSSTGGAASYEFLRDHVADIGAVWVFGGPAAVSDAVAERVLGEAGP